MLRIAFNLTKDIEIEDLQIALLHHILSKQTKEELLVRLDDRDKEHNIDQKEVLESLALFGIDYSRVVAQSENIKYYTGMGMKLLLDKKAFNCFCSDKALEQDKQKAKEEGKPYSYSGFCETISDETKFQCNAPFVVRMKKPQNNIKVKDILQGEVTYTPDEVDSVVILTHKKSPTSNFASAVDDMLFDISTIITTKSESINASKQIHIRESLGYEKEIDYLHLPKITNYETLPTVKELIDDGYLPAAIANYIIHLGYEVPNEIFTIEEAINWFDLSKISKESTNFDMDRLKSINQEHMKMLEDMRFSKILGFADDDIGKLAKLYIDQCHTTKEIKEKIDTIFSKKTTLKGFEKEFNTLKECLQNAPFIKEFDELEKYLIEKTQLKGEKLFAPLSFLLTGTTNNQNLTQIYPFIRNYLGEII